MLSRKKYSFKSLTFLQGFGIIELIKIYQYSGGGEIDMDSFGQDSEISKATVARLPAYLRFLKEVASRGSWYVSSAAIAEALGVSAVGVRKDLAFVSSQAGKPKRGFEVNTLISDIEKFLGYDERTAVVVVGAGRLGKAILLYEGFEHFRIDVVAAFDISPEKIGAVGGKPIYPLERLGEIVRRHSVKAGILTVPRESAQRACDAMVEAGIRAILNFAPASLTVPEGVSVRYEDLAASLAMLFGSVPDKNQG